MNPFVRRWWNSEIFLVPTQDFTYVSAGEQKILKIPTKVLVEIPSYRVVAFGEDARQVEHAGMGKSSVIQPFSSEEIFDEVAAQQFLRSVFQLTLGSRFFVKPRVVLSSSPSQTPFMQELWQSVLYAAGARQIVTVHPALAAAYGTGLPLQTPHGYVVGQVSGRQLSLHLVAFGHVQFEVVTKNFDQDSGKIAEQLADLWKRLLALLPIEFLATVQQDGCVLVMDTNEPEASAWLSQAVGSPVIIVPRTAEVLGLQKTEEAGK